MNLHRSSDAAFTKHLFHLLVSVSSLIYPDNPNVLYRYLKACFKVWILSRKVKPFIECVQVPEEVFIRLMPQTLKPLLKTQSFDHCVIINMELVKNHDESSRKTYLIPITMEDVTLKAASSTSTSPQCLIEAIASKDLLRSQAVMSETTYHNLRKFLNWPFTNNLMLKINELNEVVNTEPQYASKIVVSLIQTPQEIHQDLVKECLSNYFEKGRLLSLHSFFVIDICKYVPEANYTVGTENLCYLHFKVVELEGPLYEGIPNASETLGYLVTKTETTLFQTKIQSFIPRRAFLISKDQSDFSLSNVKDKLRPHCPPFLNALYTSLMVSFEPFLKITETPKYPFLKPVFWLVGPVGSGKQVLLSCVAAHFGINLWNFNCDEVFGKVSGQIEGKLKALFAKARKVTPCLLVISDIQLLCKNSEGQDDLRIISLLNDLMIEGADFPLIVVATSCNEAAVSPIMARIFLQTFVIPNLNEIDRKKLLSWFSRLQGANIPNDCLSDISGRCSGFLYSDLEALVQHAVRNKSKRDQSTNSPGRHLAREDFEEALDQMQSAYSDAIGAPKIPSVLWEDVGGLSKVKDEILRTVNTPLHHPELVALGLRRSGVLLYGPPGTGKTLIAKAVATECSLNFLSVKGPELLNMYVGQSEENVREVFERARAASPCIIFFDELDSLAPNRGKSGDSGGVMDRVVSQLLAEMDGLQKATHLFVIGATNRPDLIDPALLRPGRFDKLLYVSACEDQQSIACVLRAQMRKFRLGGDVDIENLSKQMPTQLTGADIYAVCSNAWRNAVRRAIKDFTLGIGTKSSTVEVNKDDFLGAISVMTPSVSSEDMKYFKNLQEELSGNKKYVLAS